jgi:transketolase
MMPNTITAVTELSPPFDYPDLAGLMSLMTGDEKHSAAATSTADVLWVLYRRVLCVDPAAPDDPARDRFLLSKGHGPMAYYAVLAAHGFLSRETLATFGAYDSPLGNHPDRLLIPGVEISSGSLGHGLPMAVGVALALQARGNSKSKVFCLVGDAELDEGSNHEAIALAGRRRIDRLNAIVIDNDSASYGWPGGVATRFEVEGWATTTINGRDHDSIHEALTRPHPGRPHAVVAVVERRDG